MSRRIVCDACGAVEPTDEHRDAATDFAPPDGWRRIAAVQGSGPIPEQQRADVCSPACLDEWAQREAQAWRSERLQAVGEGPRVLRVTTEVHRRRVDLGGDPLGHVCPTCTVAAGQPCDLTEHRVGPVAGGSV